MSASQSRSQTHELTLVLGIDGSGKSTFLKNLAQRTGALALEPSSSAAAKNYKRRNLNTPLTLALVQQREFIYSRLNAEFDTHVMTALESQPVATSGSRLVTAIAHAVMRRMIGGPETEMTDILQNWIDTTSLWPARIVFVHAPDEVILERIAGRQAAGHSEEKFWGYNAPSYLSYYQTALADAVTLMPSMLEAKFNSYDTAEPSPAEVMDDFLAS